MSIITSQQISAYYDQYAASEITFTKDIIKATLLYPKQVCLKCMGYQWPCIIYSSSMNSAKIIVNMKDSLKAMIKKANNVVSLRFSFIQRDKADPITFLVSAKIVSYTPYSRENQSLVFLTLQYTQRPADGLIEILGQVLEAHANSKNRRDERITLTEASEKILGFGARNAQISIQGVPRKCILRDVSFGGAKVIIMGVAKFILNKDAVLRISIPDPPENIDIPGTVIRFEAVEGRSDIAAFAIQFNQDLVPAKYKMRVNSYIRAAQSPKARAKAQAEERERQLSATRAKTEAGVRAKRDEQARRNTEAGTDPAAEG
ncbi:MAG: PilZ domain-containing protein [Spirochaetaceae bacterium]|nr:MAG: PilZ domain-containing protein [Spirochaetaceae bacterium]